MNATETAIQVIEWSLSHYSHLPPQGTLLDTNALVKPSDKLVEAMQQLVIISAGKIKLRSPLLGGSYQSLSVDNALLALAIGNCLKSPNEAMQLLRHLDQDENNSSEWIFRHTLVAPLLSHLEKGSDESLLLLRDEFLRLSPLTRILIKPPSSQQNISIAFIYKLISFSQGRRFLQHHWARPLKNTNYLSWRIDMLLQLRQTEKDEHIAFILDVYEAYLIYFWKEASHHIKQAQAIISNPLLAQDNNKLQMALSIAKWWKPLWEIKRSRNDALRNRYYLDPNKYLQGTKLYILARQLTGNIL